MNSLEDMKTKALNTQQKQKQFEKNALGIMARIGEDAYWDLFFETATRFLKTHFTQGDKYFKHHYESAEFWQWFKIEWSLWENELCDHLKMVTMANRELINELFGMHADWEVEQSFYANYLSQQKLF